MTGTGRLLPTLLIIACGGSPVPPRAVYPVAPADEALSQLIVTALAADTRLETPSGIYESDALVVADGTARYAPPRFAGLGPGGDVAVTSSRIEVRGGVAWAQVEYRWLSTAAGRAAEGRATLVMVPTVEGAWRIRHAHSSSPSRAEPPPYEGRLPLMVSRTLSALEGEKIRSRR